MYTGNSNSENPYTVVLTHDVDHLSLSSYPVCSKMTAAYLKNAFAGNTFRLLQGQIKLKYFIHSVKDGFVYPLVKVGLLDDPWECSIMRIIALEREYGVRSTFFFIPVKDNPGLAGPGIPAPRERRCTYDIGDYRRLLCEIEANGWEVGVHGLSAHANPDLVKQELLTMKELLPQKENWGFRSHWLYQGKHLWKNLQQAGYCYDASFGFNKVAGFPGEKLEPFEQDGILIVPLVIQDTTLLAKHRMHLTPGRAWSIIQAVLEQARKKRAVVTVLWHNSSYATPRLWGDLYRRIIEKALEDKAAVVRAVDLLALYRR